MVTDYGDHYQALRSIQEVNVKACTLTIQTDKRHGHFTAKAQRQNINNSCDIL